MASRQQNTIVGIFVLFGMVLAGALVIAFGGGRSLLAQTWDLQVHFPEGVEGVQAGQTVTLNGKRIGETSDVRFADDRHVDQGVVVIVGIEGYALPAACEMVVAAPLMGLGKPLIQIALRGAAEPGRTLPKDGTARISGRMLQKLDQLIPPRTQATLETATARIGELAAALKPVAEDFHHLLERRTTQDVDLKGVTANLATVIQRFDGALRSFNQVFGDQANQKHLAEVLANARKMSESGAAAMKNFEELTGQGRQLVGDTGQLMRKLAATTDGLSALLTRMDQAVTSVNGGHGTVGMLMNDNRLYEELLLTARRMTKMLDEFREVLDIIKKGQLRLRAF
jgi:phospholipid/cholesterol/gamma-HCH transport system substrate-binding protein